MDIAIFIGKLLGITLAIWFLFYKKKEMPNLQKWGLSLGFSLLFLLAMFGLGAMMGLETLIPKNIDGKSQSGLNTELKENKRGCWEVGAGEICEEDIWRFISHRELTGKVAEAQRELGMIAVKGAYKINWHNETKKKLQVNYHLRFWDANKLEIARYDPGSGFEFVIFPADSADSKEISGTFEIKVDNLEAANSISQMRVFASFKKIDAD